MLVPFDTLNYTRKLEAAGFSREQAEAQAETQSHALGEFFRHQDEKFIQTLATKDDLYDSRIRASEAIESFKADVSGEFISLRDVIYDFKEETRKEFQNVRGEIQSVRNELQDFKEETRKEFQNVRGELQEFREETRKEFQSMRESMVMLENKMTNVLSDFRHDLVKWFIGTLIGLVGVAIGIGSFVLTVWFK